jgi:hypothetical protein
LSHASNPGGVLGFADTVRDVAAATFGSRYETQEEKAALDQWWAVRLGNLYGRPVTGRSILQIIGTELFRDSIHPDFWVLCAERRLAKLDPARLATWIFADVRYDNEASWIKSRGGRIIHLSRGAADIGGTHRSEAGVSSGLIDNAVRVSTIEDTQRHAGRLAICYGISASYSSDGGQ